MIARFLRSLLLFVSLVLFLAPAGSAAGPFLDRSFGIGGRVTGSAPRNAVLTGFAAVRSPEGRIYVDQGPTLHAFLSNGTPDPGFGEGGAVTFAVAPWPTYFTVAGVAVDDQGRVLVAATTGNNDPDPGEPAQVATVVRYLPDGRLDPGFAEGGVLRTTFGLPLPRDESGLSPASAEHVAVRLGGVGVDGNGRILLAGSYAERTVKCPNGGSYEMPLAFFARLGPDGRLDGTFGHAGLAVQAGLGQITDVRLASSGISTFTATPPGCELPREGALARLDEAGSPDTRFGVGGRRPLAEPPLRLTTAPDGRLLVLSAPRRVGEGGEGHSLAVVQRFRGNGTLDRSFARRGRTAVRLPGRSSLFGAIAVDPRGRVLLAGAVRAPGSGPPRRFVLRRLGADGLPDTGFGSRGTLSTGFGGRARASARAIMLEPNGRIVLAGALGASYLVNEVGFARTRYRR